MISVESKGDFTKTLTFLNRIYKHKLFSSLDKFGQMGVEALARATPKDTGFTSESWKYRIVKDNRGYGIEWYNTNIVNGVPVVVLIQYGHGTRNGGYVPGYDFINPVIRPIFDLISEEIWKEVRRD